MEQYMIDIILAAVFITVTVVYFVKGFAKTVLKFAAFLGSIICSKLFLNTVTDWVFSNTRLFAGTEKYIAKLILMVVCFLVFLFVFTLIARLADKIFELPVLKQANKLLGGVLGAGIGLILVIILSVALQISSHVVYNSKYANSVKSSIIVQTVLPEEKLEINIDALK